MGAVLAVGQPGALGAGEEVRDAEFVVGLGPAAGTATADRRERREGAEDAEKDDG